ncbi:MAG: hypothetical protein E4G94_02370 [ANME-2 cluster archaeon]|nr:MAG: hypothetical protein E4G94_02370 [ANME-2 cluster archaeon]
MKNIAASFAASKPVPDTVVKPSFFGTDKGAIVKAMCIDGCSSLSEIQHLSNLSEAGFWDSFYSLLSDGSIESTDKGGYNVRKTLTESWIKYFSHI